MSDHYKILIDPDLTNKVFYPPTLKIVNPVRRIAFGSHVVEVNCIPHPEKIDVVVLSEDIRLQLLFPNLQIPLHIFIANDTLHLGPLVGIFTSGFTSFPFKPLGERSSFFTKLLAMGKTVGVFPFIFGTQHINWENGVIDGLFYLNDQWKSISIPFPNVIYDRLPNRKSENNMEIKNIKERLQFEYMIPWYNPGFFNKMDTFNKFFEVTSIRKYLPDTQSFSSISIVKKMLTDYGHVFIKPKNGSLGLGIYQIVYNNNPDGYYFCRYRDHKGNNKLTKYKSLEGLINHLFRGRKLENMLVQQGIKLIRVNQRPIDFRVHTNKDKLGNWTVSAIAAKIAANGSVTTHIHNGGEIKTIEEVFPMKNEQSLYLDKLSEVALKLSTVLEQQNSGIIGEIGFDIGIDRHGEVWVFEANSKPGRSIFKHPQLKNYEYLTRKLALDFSVFITKNSITMPEVTYN